MQVWTGIILRDQKELKVFAVGSMMIALRKLRLLHLIRLRKMPNMPEEKMPSFTHLSLKVLVLYDVPIEAKGSYRPECVPYISLMSRLNGRPVIGHPLAIEKLSGGMYDDLIRMVKCRSSSWELDTSDYRDVDMVYGKRPCGIAMSKHNHLQARSSPTKSWSRSMQNALLSKKIRKLSSLTSSRRGKEKRQPVFEKLKGPCIACIPLNVVFSRIMMAMNSST